ncbi:MAG: hypothetical protein Q9182_000410 [Xanthomendoza sp. 2 TL-2023]
MPLFQNLRKSFGGYWTPEKHKPKPSTSSPSSSQRTTRSSSLAEGKARLDREGTASPRRRISDWNTNPSEGSKTPKALGVKGSKVAKTPMINKQSAEDKQRFWNRFAKLLSKEPKPETPDSLEGSTAIGEDRSSLPPGFDSEDTQIEFRISPEVEEYTISDSAEPVTEEGEAVPALVAPGDDDRFYRPTDEDREVMKTWTKDQVWLFHELNNRSLKPLIRETWRDYDFVTFPDDVVSDDDEDVLVKPHDGSEYNGKSHKKSVSPATSAGVNSVLFHLVACRALRNLFLLGSRVRDKRVCGLASETIMRREFHEFYKWSMADAGLSHLDLIPLLTIGTAFPNESIDSLVGRVTDSLHDLGRRYRQLFSTRDEETGEPIKDPETGKITFTRDLPTLYGIIIYKHVATIVTYDARFPKKGIQLMNTNNFIDLEEDVWHAFSVAITMIKARNDLIGMMEDGVIWPEMEDDDTHDPDE